jgi:alpha-tubulin suppressor-like RCC1 family protein
MGRLSTRLVVPAAAWMGAASMWVACSGGSSDGGAPDLSPDSGQADATNHADASEVADDGGTDALTAPVGADAADTGANEEAAADAAPEAGPPQCFVDAGSPYLADAVDLSAGADFACAVRQGGSVVCWGFTPNGMAGTIAATSVRPTTVQFPADAGAVHIVRVAVSAAASCGLDTSGGVWCWGYGPQTGGGAGDVPNQKPVPSPVVDSSGTPIHAVGLGNGYDHFCALEAAGAVECWGRNDQGQLGTDAGNDAGSYSFVAGPVPGVNLAGGSLAVGGGGFFSCGANGSTAACWGANSAGQCASAPTVAPALNTNVYGALSEAGAALPLAQISDGVGAACAIDHLDQLFCWGSNDESQRGDQGATTGSPPNSVAALADAGVTSVSCGYDLTCVVDANSHARCFGTDVYGYLGDGRLDGGPTSIAQTVVDVDGGAALFPVSRIAAGGDQSCAIVAGSCGLTGPGTVVCWGWNGNENLGNPEAGATSAVPVFVLSP